MMYSREEIITPEIARAYLSHNVRNRKQKPGAQRNYARDMKNGNWQLSPNGISFFENGDLADGQNRLEAVIKADVPVEMYVTYNVRNDCSIFDRGVSRSTADSLTIAGESSAIANTNAVALVNFLFTLCGINNPSEALRIKFAVDNEELIKQTLSVSGTKIEKPNICRKVAVTGAIFCALACGMPEEGLRDFCAIANTGFGATPEKSSAVVLRKFVENEYTGKNMENKRDAFTFATNAIRDFARGTPRTKRYRDDIKPLFFEWTRKNILQPYLDTYSN